MAMRLTTTIRTLFYCILLFCAGSVTYNVTRLGFCSTFRGWACNPNTFSRIHAYLDPISPAAASLVADLIAFNGIYTDPRKDSASWQDFKETSAETDGVWKIDEPTDRHSFPGLGSPNTVRCWPSTGGIVIASGVPAVLLEYLGLDRFNNTLNTRSFNTTEEDAFCRQVRKIGGKWWEGNWDWVDATTKNRRMTEEEMAVLFLGWPADGGVWVLKERRREDLRAETGRISNAFTMDERCRAIEMSGGTFFADPKDCSDTRDLV